MPTPSMSVRNSGFASIRTAFVSGCGWLATVLLPSRLCEYDDSTARASGVPAAAVTSRLRDCRRTWL